MRSATTIVAVVAITVGSWAQSGGAVVTGTGKLKINGKESASGTVLASSDKVSTGAESTATVTQQGAMFLLAPNTTAGIQGKQLALEEGTVAVTAKETATVAAGGLLVSASGARFEVTRHRCDLSVAALSGTVTLSDNTSVAEGQRVTRRDPACALAAAPAAAVGATSGRVLAGAAGLAAAAAIAAYLSVDKDAVSPSRP